ncbi:hypothetical protein ABT025_13505 [Streptomyces sp. NPDC002809]|uniref:hypothetical protein n=1 Tax=Streptomyces sp. NPDC002809 TaxID=3154433 RepID=UPI00333330E3
MTRRTRTASVTLLCVFALTSCGKSADDLFSNLNGTQSSDTSDHRAPAGGASPANEPPNYGDNSRATRPDRPSAADEQRAHEKADEIRAALQDLRRQHRIDPIQVRPVLARLAAPAHLAVEQRPGRSGQSPARGSVYGIWIGKSACLTGAVTQERVWTEINGHFPETGCLPPAATH